MANMVTRDFNITKGTALIFSEKNGKIIDKPFALVGKYSDKRLGKAVKDFFCDEDETFVKIKEKSYEKELYGMKSEDFLKNAVKLNRETRKPE